MSHGQINETLEHVNRVISIQGGTVLRETVFQMIDQVVKLILWRPHPASLRRRKGPPEGQPPSLFRCVGGYSS